MGHLTSLEFSYTLCEPGKATATFSSCGETTEFDLSNVCNPLGDLLGALDALVANPTHLWGETNAAAFVWYCENESYNWQLTLGQGDRLTLRVTETCEFFGDDEVEIISGDCPLRDFLAVVVATLDTLVKKVGLLNYHQQWQTDEFPLTSFLFLKKWLIDNGVWMPGATAQLEGTLASEVRLLLG